MEAAGEHAGAAERSQAKRSKRSDEGVQPKRKAKEEVGDAEVEEKRGRSR